MVTGRPSRIPGTRNAAVTGRILIPLTLRPALATGLKSVTAGTYGHAALDGLLVQRHFTETQQ